MTGWALWSLPLGSALDALLGDPPVCWHPVRAIGRLIVVTERALETLLTRVRGGPRARRLAGVVLAVVVVGATAGTAWGFVTFCDRCGAATGLFGRGFLIFWGLAARSLGDEALHAAAADDLPAARQALAQIVGRDTEALERPEICRACVETVAENCTDAAIAPLFWFVVGGPVGLWAYKAVSTLDSMVGYRNERYADLGWASARLDDGAALVPARLTWLLLALAALLLGERAGAAVRIGWRDGRNHPSPNSAWGEAATAGALGVQLGGPSTYAGVPSKKPTLGEPGAVIGPETVRRAVRLMRLAAVLGCALAWGIRAGALGLP